MKAISLKHRWKIEIECWQSNYQPKCSKHARDERTSHSIVGFRFKQSTHLPQVLNRGRLSLPLSCVPRKPSSHRAWGPAGRTTTSQTERSASQWKECTAGRGEQRAAGKPVQEIPSAEV